MGNGGRFTCDLCRSISVAQPLVAPTPPDHMLINQDVCKRTKARHPIVLKQALRGSRHACAVSLLVSCGANIQSIYGAWPTDDPQQQ